MLWSALRLPNKNGAPSPTDDDLRALGTWALQFTPRVSVLEESIVLEVEASTRLFKGRRALRDRVVAESSELGVTGLSWAPTSLGALALARASR